jgi:membrane protein
MRRIVGFFRAWIAHFVGIQGVDRAMAVAALAFSALIPLLIVYSAVVPRPDGEDFADSLVDRFDLEGSAAESVRQAFTAPASVEDSLNVVGILLTIIAALSFTRALQRMYEQAYVLPARGMRGTSSGLVWLGFVAVFASVRPFVSELFDSGAASVVVAIVLSGTLWTLTPYLLLGRRMDWHALIPGAALAGFGMTALVASSIVWFPPTIESSAEQYGVIGVAFSLLSWLVSAGFVIVIAACGGAVAVRREGVPAR